ncbi:MAG: hypothetical protein HRJ53_02990 [Acidobacteria bacterium Pan2503]|uniref:Uncharacterized protein n=1 Tax=Candidatus Acidiferrum panamense TaxID=2741543 RepID=A0A7V8SVJ8_9BACT|nr:hypothetical protein [Candidatus Acidoferrum panamensis]
MKFTEHTVEHLLYDLTELQIARIGRIVCGNSDQIRGKWVPKLGPWKNGKRTFRYVHSGEIYLPEMNYRAILAQLRDSAESARERILAFADEFEKENN